MEIWLDANISPVIAGWLCKEFALNCIALREIGLRDAGDSVIFKAAKAKDNVVIIYKR